VVVVVVASEISLRATMLSTRCTVSGTLFSVISVMSQFLAMTLRLISRTSMLPSTVNCVAQLWNATTLNNTRFSDIPYIINLLATSVRASVGLFPHAWSFDALLSVLHQEWL